MQFPKSILNFVLHGVTEAWKYKGKEFACAEYVQLGNSSHIFIRATADKDGNQIWEVQFRSSKIRSLATLEEAIAVIEDIIQENPTLQN